MTVRFLDLEHNNIGKDFFCGDLHGTFAEFMNSLDEAGFDYSVDRLFCVGDLHDRGPHSMECLGLLGKDWFYTVDCNHNEILSDFMAGNMSEQELKERGAQWFLDKPRREQLRVLQSLTGLPTCIRIGRTTDARVNLFHAEFLGTDLDLDECKSISHQGENIDCKSSLLWGRALAQQLVDGKHVELGCANGLSASFVGHTVVRSPFEFQNHIFMDCGIWSHSNKNKQAGKEALNFPLYCLSTNQWYFCKPDEETLRYTDALWSRVRTLLDSADKDQTTCSRFG